uniref:C2 domain-containing protein n=1 Tax=Anabas testudineus TaxID=64144 RepID=A0A7N6FFA4_ANATE
MFSCAYCNSDTISVCVFVQINVNILEAQKLVGVNISPAVFIRVGDQKKHTATQKSTNCPFYNENFQFEFQEAPQILFDKVIEIKVVHRRTLAFLMTHIGTFKIDISTVYNQPDHRFYQKWAPLTDPADTRSGIKGYVKASLSVLMKGDALGMPSLPPSSSSGASEDIEKNLLLPRGMAPERPWARFRLRIYRAEGLPTMDAGLMAKMSKVTDRTVFIDPYVQVTFAGQQGETSVASATSSPIWNEEISFIEQFPPLAQRIRVQVLDDAKMGDIALATHFLDLQQISDPTRKGFNPTFGPSWVNLDFCTSCFTTCLFYCISVRLYLSLRSYQCVPLQPPSIKQKPCLHVWSQFEDHSFRLYQANWLNKMADRLVRFNTIPDVFIWLLSGSKRLAYVRIPSYSILFSLVEEQRGRDCGKVATLYMKSPGGSASEVFAKLEVYLWLGLAKYRKRKLPVTLSYSRYFQLRCHLYQGRGLLAADDDGLSDPFAKVLFSTQCQVTRVLTDTLSPAWCECLLFDRVLLEGTREELQRDPPLIIINVFDYDSVVTLIPKPLGRAFAEPEFKPVEQYYQKPRLRFYDISMGRVPAGELLAAFELIELDYSAFGEVTPINESINQRLFTIPEGVRPVLKTFRIEVLFWGLRELKRVQLFEVERPKVKVECAGRQLESEEIENYKTNPNFKEVELPEQAYLHPPLMLFVVEQRAFGRLALVGSHVVQSLMDYAPRDDDGEPEEEEEIKLKSDLESEFSQFQDWLQIFPLYKGRSSPDDEEEDDEERLMGKYKGSFLVFPLEPGDEENTTCQITNGIPRNSPIKVLVRVYIVKASSLAPTDPNGKADPYLIVRVGQQSLDTKDRYIPKQLNPTFGEVFELTVSFPLETELVIMVMDHDLIGSDDVIGETRVDLENRFYSRHRASCGLALYYDTDGYNKWRDAKKPSTILGELCRKNGIPSPEYRTSEIKVLNKIFKIPTEAVPEGRTNRQYCEHAALNVLHRWGEMKEFLPVALPLVPEHVEIRSLMNQDKPGLPQKKLELTLNISGPRLPEQYELRVIIWNTDDVFLDDINPFTGDPSSDIYVKGWIKGLDGDKQETDVHFNSLTGEGNFNWRFVFRFDYLPTEKEVVYKKKESIFSLDESEFRQPAVLTLQVWDYDRIAANDFLGSIELRLCDMVRPAKSSTKCTIDMAKDRAGPRFSIFRAKKMKGWWPLTRQKTLEDFEREEKEKEEAELQLVTLEQADANPVGRARKEPEPLEKPNRPTTSFAWFVNPMKTFIFLIWKKYKKYIIALVILAILTIFLVLILYTMPQQISSLIIKG